MDISEEEEELELSENEGMREDHGAENAMAVDSNEESSDHARPVVVSSPAFALLISQSSEYASSVYRPSSMASSNDLTGSPQQISVSSHQSTPFAPLPAQQLEPSVTPSPVPPPAIPSEGSLATSHCLADNDHPIPPIDQERFVLPPSDSPVGTIREDNSEEDEVPEWSEDEDPDNVSATPQLDLAFSDEFSILANAHENRQALEELEAQSVDVDRWELVISPEEYLLRFRDTLATVQLVNRVPLRPLHSTSRRGPHFDQWMLLAQANHQLWIDPKYKAAFFDVLEEHQTVQPGQFPRQASLGSVHVSTSVFVHCLNEAGCDTIMLKAYGQKTPLESRFLDSEPAQVDHRWSIHNEWDIGRTFTSDKIWLFAGTDGRQRGMQHFPMLIPGSGNFGTVNIKATFMQRKFTIKIYPRLVHVIKSFNSRLQGSIPKTVQGIRNQVAASLRMIHSLSSKRPEAIGGFRIEVTVKAKSLRDAHRFVEATGYLNPEYWLKCGTGRRAVRGLTAKVVTKQGLIANANWVHDQANQAKLFTGASANKPTGQQIQAVVDILNALGWNAGIRSPTKSLDPDAWWFITPSSDRSGIFQILSERYQTDEGIRELFDRARKDGPYHSLPCKAEPGNPNHRYQVHNRSPFRVRCSAQDCGNKLQRTALVHWIAELVQGAVISMEVLTQ
jgi:hypothetical protein